MNPDEVVPDYNDLLWAVAKVDEEIAHLGGISALLPALSPEWETWLAAVKEARLRFPELDTNY